MNAATGEIAWASGGELVADKIPGAKFEVIKGDGSSHVVPIAAGRSLLCVVRQADLSALAPEWGAVGENGHVTRQEPVATRRAGTQVSN